MARDNILTVACFLPQSLTATVVQIPTGLVLLTDDSGEPLGLEPLLGGKATFTVEVGPNMTKIDSTYSGDGFFAASGSVSPFYAIPCKAPYWGTSSCPN